MQHQKPAKDKIRKLGKGEHQTSKRQDLKLEKREKKREEKKERKSPKTHKMGKGKGKGQKGWKQQQLYSSDQYYDWYKSAKRAKDGNFPGKGKDWNAKADWNPQAAKSTVSPGDASASVNVLKPPPARGVSPKTTTTEKVSGTPTETKKREGTLGPNGLPWGEFPQGKKKGGKGKNPQGEVGPNGLPWGVFKQQALKGGNSKQELSEESKLTSLSDQSKYSKRSLSKVSQSRVASKRERENQSPEKREVSVYEKWESSSESESEERKEKNPKGGEKKKSEREGEKRTEPNKRIREEKLPEVLRMFPALPESAEKAIQIDDKSPVEARLIANEAYNHRSDMKVLTLKMSTMGKLMNYFPETHEDQIDERRIAFVGSIIGRLTSDGEGREKRRLHRIEAIAFGAKVDLGKIHRIKGRLEKKRDDLRDRCETASRVLLLRYAAGPQKQKGKEGEKKGEPSVSVSTSVEPEIDLRPFGNLLEKLNLYLSDGDLELDSSGDLPEFMVENLNELTTQNVVKNYKFGYDCLGSKRLSGCDDWADAAAELQGGKHTKLFVYNDLLLKVGEIGMRDVEMGTGEKNPETQTTKRGEEEKSSEEKATKRARTEKREGEEDEEKGENEGKNWTTEDRENYEKEKVAMEDKFAQEARELQDDLNKVEMEAEKAKNYNTKWDKCEENWGKKLEHSLKEELLWERTFGTRVATQRNPASRRLGYLRECLQRWTHDDEEEETHFVRVMVGKIDWARHY